MQALVSNNTPVPMHVFGNTIQGPRKYNKTPVKADIQKSENTHLNTENTVKIPNSETPCSQHMNAFNI